MRSDSEEDRERENVIYASWRTPSHRTSSSNIAHNRGANTISTVNLKARERVKTISTAPGQQCAGETETELDEPSPHLPTSRIISPSGPLIPPNNLNSLLFEISRLLSIVPAVIGTLYNIYHIYHPPPDRIGDRAPPERVDFLISALWSILTGYQCLRLATGLLSRWRHYYPPLPTLIRLLALQAICWPATHFTLQILEHEKRPVVVWAVIGTTTSISRSVQIWVTSNLWWERIESKDGKPVNDLAKGGRRVYWKNWGGKWGGRRWNWAEVGKKCVLPVGVVYFVMAWAEQFRREWSGC